MVFFVDKERLFNFLKMGYFMKYGKSDNYVFVQFYEEYARAINIETKEGTEYQTAKIYIDSLNIILIPSEIPAEICDNYYKNQRIKWDSLQKKSR